MPIFFFCPNCGREIRVGSIYAGRKGRCVDCDAAVVVPDIDPIMLLRPAAKNPDVESTPKPSAFESSVGIPTVNRGFEDGGDAEQESPRP
jgi:hypothetical protein